MSRVFQIYGLSLERDSYETIFSRMRRENLRVCLIQRRRQMDPYLGKILFITDDDFMPYLEKALREYGYKERI